MIHAWRDKSKRDKTFVPSIAFVSSLDESVDQSQDGTAQSPAVAGQGGSSVGRSGVG